MTYEYRCLDCNKRFDVYKSMKDMERNENCPRCGEFAERLFVPSRVHLSKTKVEHPEYNPGLGQVVKNRSHKQEIMKRKGLEEVGNDFGSGEKMQAHFDAERQSKRDKAYEDI